MNGRTFHGFEGLIEGHVFANRNEKIVEVAEVLLLSDETTRLMLDRICLMNPTSIMRLFLREKMGRTRKCVRGPQSNTGLQGRPMLLGVGSDDQLNASVHRVWLRQRYPRWCRLESNMLHI